MNNQIGLIALLDSHLTRTIDMVKFAESKNAMLIALLGALLVGIYTQLASFDHINQVFILYFGCFYVLAVASFIVSLISFLPRVAPPLWINIRPFSELDNPFYFGDACKYTSKAYAELCTNRYVAAINDTERLLLIDLSNQITINSRIAWIKFKSFDLSLWLLVGALLTPMVAMPLYYSRGANISRNI